MVRSPPCITDQRRRAGRAQIVHLLDRGQLAEHQFRRRLAQHHGQHAGLAQQLLLELVTDLLVGRCLERQGGEVGRGDPLVEIGLAKARDRGDVDQHLAEQDERHGQHEQTRRERPVQRRLMKLSRHVRGYRRESDPCQPATGTGSGAGTPKKPRR
jgi:hypothetical protein